MVFTRPAWIFDLSPLLTQLAVTMQLVAERSAARSGDALVAGSVRGALAASLSRAP